jgi:LuxR family transcriptional regulator, maltose regulon positive regulatory protein
VSTLASGGPPDAVERIRRPSSEPLFDLAEAKLRPPAVRRGIVARTALLDRLLAASAPSVISVVAPAGYGKTTVLAQWAECKEPRVAWVSVDHRDNDPVVLLTYIAVALDRIEPIEPRVFQALASSGAGIEVPRRLVAAIGRMRHPVSLVIDHFEAVTNPECLDAVAALALGLPGGWQLAIGSRDALPLPAPRLRAQGGFAEVGVDELAMDRSEAGPLLMDAEVELADADVDELVGKTEGWPVGLYLAALAVKAGGSHTAAGVPLTGEDRFIGDYLRSEILDRVSLAEASFLTHTSILDRMCGPLCDAVLRAKASGELLERLESRNLLVVPLDRRREWYRYHHLFRELLLSEMRRREPEIITELHLRATVWFEANGLPETAIDHAQAAGDHDRVADLVLRVVNPVWTSGRSDTVLHWMEWFEANDLVEHYPAIAVHGALMFALAGRPGGTERWAAAAEASSTTGVLADGNTMEATVAYLRALLCRDGVEQMRRDAQIAWDGLSAGSPYRATMLHAEGLSYLLEGDPDRADAIFSHAVDVATRAGVLPFVPVLLAARGLVAIELDDWMAASMLAEQAMTMMQGGRFDDYWTSALVYAWAAHVALQRGDPAGGREHVARAARLRPLLTYALPVVSVQALLEMARAYISLADPGGARAVLRQAHDIFQQRPALGTLPQQAEELRARVETIRAEGLGASSLTTAELRLLPLLPTHLSFREIGERLYVSRHTVKTQAISIYRKLGVSSRSETIDRMHELGLLEQV